MGKLKILLAVVCFWLMIGQADSAQLVWTENSEADLKGYNVYYEGVDSSDVIDVGLDNFLDLEFLVDGVEYRFNVTAYDTSYNESEFSEDLFWTKTTTSTTSIVTTTTVPTTSTTSIIPTTIPTTSTTTSIITTTTTSIVPTTSTTSSVKTTTTTSIVPTTTTTSIIITTTTSKPTTTSTSIVPTTVPSTTTTTIKIISTSTTTSIPSTTTTTIDEWIPCLADINGDGFVDELDEDILWDEFGTIKCRKRGRKKCLADFNRDRKVDELDEEILMNEFGRDDCNESTVLEYAISQFVKHWKKKLKR